MMTATIQPRIYVADLAAYNNGRLHGAWIDADQDADAIHQEITDMLAASPEPLAEEWAIHDYEGFAPLTLSEYESIDRVAALGQAIGEHGEAFAAYVDHVGIDYATVADFKEDYCGEYDSEEAYGEELFDELYGHDVPGFLQGYIDYEKWTRDLFLGDYTSVDAPSGNVYIFRNN